MKFVTYSPSFASTRLQKKIQNNKKITRCSGGRKLRSPISLVNGANGHEFRMIFI